MKNNFLYILFFSFIFLVIVFFSERFFFVDQSFALERLTKNNIASDKNTGKDLSLAISEAIDSDSVKIMQILSEKDKRKIILQSVSFVKVNGVISGKGEFWDGLHPRLLTIYLDAYGDTGPILESYVIQLQSNGERQNFEIFASDKATFSRFAFRFLYEGEELKLSSPNDPDLNIGRISPNAILFPSDYDEVILLLSKLELLSPGVEQKDYEAISLFEDVKRFRNSRGIEGPNFITLGDLYALRIDSNTFKSEKHLFPYILWVSSLDGGRSIERPIFIDKEDEDLSSSEEGLESKDNIENINDPNNQPDNNVNNSDNNSVNNSFVNAANANIKDENIDNN